MKKTLLAVVLAVCFALPAMAKNSVNVSGDIVKDGQLTVDVNWTIDTANYKGMSREAMRQKVRQEIKDQVISKIVTASQGMALSLDQSHFNLLKEHMELSQTRPDGSKLYTYNMQIQFSAPGTTPLPATPPAAAAPVQKPKYEDALNQRWQNEL